MRRDLEDEAVRRVKASNGDVFDRVVAGLAEEEIGRRAALVVDALGNLKRHRADLAKLRPDQVSYDLAGAPIQEGYSKARLDERQKAQKAIDRYEAAFDKAFADPPDYGPLKDCVKGSQRPGEKAAAPDLGGEG